MIARHTEGEYLVGEAAQMGVEPRVVLEVFEALRREE